MSDGVFSDWAQLHDGLPERLTAIAPLSLAAMFDEAAARHPHAVYLSYQGIEIGYRQADGLIDALAASLQAQGIEPGDRIGLAMPSHPAYAIAVNALWRIGACGVGMNPLYGLPMLRHITRDAGVVAILTTDSPASFDKISHIADEAAVRLVVIRHDASELIAGTGVFKPERPARRARIRPTLDLAMIQYTGGTTGEPKGVMLTHANFCASCVQQRSKLPKMRSGIEVALVGMPLTHIGSLLSSLIYITALAGELAILDRFSADLALETIARRRVSFISGAPTILIALLGATDAETADWSRLTHVLSAAAPTPIEIQQRFTALTGAHVRNCYGSTETGPGIAMQDGDGQPSLAAGTPFPLTDVSIRDPEQPMAPMPRGEVGEICVAGPQVMCGYWNNVAATAASFAGAHFRTGDLGRFDENGELEIVDRLKDVINVSGYKVYPRLIEEAVYTHPDIAEAIVVGMPDAYRGETVKLFVVSRGDATLTLDALQAFLKDKLSPMEMPKQFEQRAELPRTAVGKLSRLELREGRATLP